MIRASIGNALIDTDVPRKSIASTSEVFFGNSSVWKENPSQPGAEQEGRHHTGH
jgi:hypothetical protein